MVALPVDGGPSQMDAAGRGKADAGDADGFRGVTTHNEVVEVKVIGAAKGGLVNDRDGVGTGGQRAGNGVGLIGGPSAGAGESLVRESIGAVDGNEPAGIAGAGSVAEGERVRPGRRAVDVEVNGLTVRVPTGDVAPTGEGAIEGFKADIVQGGIFGLVLVRGATEDWLGPAQLTEKTVEVGLSARFQRASALALRTA